MTMKSIPLRAMAGYSAYDDRPRLSEKERHNRVAGYMMPTWKMNLNAWLIPVWAFPSFQLYVYLGSTPSRGNLEQLGITGSDADEYLDEGRMSCSGRCRIYEDRRLGIIFVKHWNERPTPGQMAILVHELNHASHNIQRTCNPMYDEEAQSYLLDWLFTQCMYAAKPVMDHSVEPYSDEDFLWREIMHGRNERPATWRVRLRRKWWKLKYAVTGKLKFLRGVDTREGEPLRFS